MRTIVRLLALKSSYIPLVRHVTNNVNSVGDSNTFPFPAGKRMHLIGTLSYVMLYTNNPAFLVIKKKVAETCSVTHKNFRCVHSRSSDRLCPHPVPARKKRQGKLSVPNEAPRRHEEWGSGDMASRILRLQKGATKLNYV
jgi:hypothetical protein